MNRVEEGNKGMGEEVRVGEVNGVGMCEVEERVVELEERAEGMTRMSG